MSAPTTTLPAAAPANADPREIAKFDELAAGWWDESGDSAPLHRINPLRLAWIESHAPLAAAKVVDVGCGGGILAEAMARRGARVLGIDLSDKALRVARLHALESGVRGATYRRVAVEALADEMPGRADVVTCMEMLEHVPDPASVIRACAALVRPGGHVFFSTLQRSFKAWAMAIVGAEHLLRLVPRGTHDASTFIRSSELARGCRAAGLHPRAMAGIGYEPLTRRFFTTDDTSVNYMMACVRP